MDNQKKRMLVVVAILIVAGFGLYFYRKTLGNELVASGTIEATEITVSSKSVGRILDLKFDEGANVKEGDVLAVVETSELKESLRSARSRYNIAKEDFKRTKQLFTDKMISPQQYDASASALDVASANLETASIQFGNASIKAPISGTILVKAIEKGELATIGTPIATLADLTNVKLTVYLPEKLVGHAKLGEEVKVSVDSYPNEKFTGFIDYISSKAEFTPKSIQTKDERVTQVFGIKIRIPNPDMRLKPGMPADADFTKPSAK